MQTKVEVSLIQLQKKMGQIGGGLQYSITNKRGQRNSSKVIRFSSLPLARIIFIYYNLGRVITISFMRHKTRYT